MLLNAERAYTVRQHNDSSLWGRTQLACTTWNQPHGKCDCLTLTVVLLTQQDKILSPSFNSVCRCKVTQCSQKYANKHYFWYFFCKVLFFMIWPSPLTVFPIDNYILHNSVLPILWQQFLERPFPVSTWYLQHRLWGVVTQHQCLSSLELLWLNGGKSQQPGS